MKVVKQKFWLLFLFASFLSHVELSFAIFDAVFIFPRCIFYIFEYFSQ